MSPLPASLIATPLRENVARSDPAWSQPPCALSDGCAVARNSTRKKLATPDPVWLAYCRHAVREIPLSFLQLRTDRVSGQSTAVGRVRLSVRFHCNSLNTWPRPRPIVWLKVLIKAVEQNVIRSCFILAILEHHLSECTLHGTDSIVTVQVALVSKTLSRPDR